MKLEQKDRAIQLRQEGLSYSEILKSISVAKSTLSLWLRSVGLSKKQRQRLTEKKLASALRGARTKKELRLRKVRLIKEEAKKEVETLIEDPLWLAGTLLYWAEGSKEKPWRTGAKVTIANMDVEVHKIFLSWIWKYCGVKKSALGFELFIHQNGRINQTKSFWSSKIGIPKTAISVYFKKGNPNPKRKNTGISYNGVLRIFVRRSTDLNRKIAGWIEGVIEYLQKE